MVSPSHTLDPRRDGVAEHIAEQGGDRHPLLVSGGVLLAGYVAVTGVLLAVGFLVTKVLSDHGVNGFDSGITDWLVARRKDGLNDLTKYATYLANTEPVVAIAVVVTGLLLAFRKWRQAIFLASALVIELAVFLLVNYTVARPRPDVVRLNATPATSSFPSGHAAASLVLWVGIALIVATLTTNVLARVLSLVPVATLVWLVPFSRVYRGMHYTTDVLAGLIMGAGALVVGCCVARTWVAASERRHAAAVEPAPRRPTEMLGAGR